MRFIASILFAVFFQSAATWEPCDSACENVYQEAVESCERFEDVTDDAEALKLCLEKAEATRDSCLDECD